MEANGRAGEDWLLRLLNDVVGRADDAGESNRVRA